VPCLRGTTDYCLQRGRSRRLDRLDEATRSRVMASVPGQGSRLERSFEELLTPEEVSECRWHAGELAGRPDVAFDSHSLVIFVDSCFWHGCPKHVRMPRSNRAYWLRKIERNAVRDRAVSGRLRRDGWSVMRVWEHDLKDAPSRVRARLSRMLEAR
jgi:DNA mismatch endonuclease (patch repair protein)